MDETLAGLENYTHPTGDGNKHVPAAGTTNSGKVLTVTDAQGTLGWVSITAAQSPVTSVAGRIGDITLTAADFDYHQIFYSFLWIFL